MLDLSNPSWSLASRSYRNEPLRSAIAAQSIALLSAAAPQTSLGNPLTLVWALWCSGQECLERAVFKHFADHGILVELASCSIALMGNEWRRLRPVDVQMELAVQAVCFWSDNTDI